MDLNKKRHPVYLGDSVYAQLDGCGDIILTTDSHLRSQAQNVIVLEPEVCNRLREYLDESRSFNTKINDALGPNVDERSNPKYWDGSDVFLD